MTDIHVKQNTSRGLERRFIRFSKVQEITSLSSSEIYRRIADGSFPKQIRLGSRSVVWLEGDIYKWVDTLVERSIAREA